MKKLIQQITRHFNRQHQYRCRFTYLDRFGRVVFSYMSTVGVADQSTIEKHRDLKKAVANAWAIKIKIKHSHQLCNGSIQFEPVCYLGRW